MTYDTVSLLSSYAFPSTSGFDYVAGPATISGVGRLSNGRLQFCEIGMGLSHQVRS
jgi:hypothetical protein